jgi:predicted PurR-regulated permease PerM
MTTYRNYTIHITGRAVSLLLGVAAAVWLVTGFNKILFILFLAILLAVGIDPLVDRMERRKVPRALGIMIVYLVLLGILVAAIALLVPVLVDESNQLATNLPKMVAQAAELPRQWHIPGLERLSGPELAQRVGNEIGGVGAGVPKLVVGIGKAVTGVLVSALLVLVVGFFLSSDAHFAPRFIARFFSPRARPTVTELAREISGRLGHWVRAQLLVGLFFGTFFGIGLAILGVPFALSLGVAGAVLELIPYVGGATVTVIAMVVAITVAPWKALAVLVLEIIVANIESHVFYPKIVGSAVGLHPLVIILALFIGAEAKGIIGALVAVPLAVVLQVVFDRFYRFEDTGRVILPGDDPPPPPGDVELVTE